MARELSLEELFVPKAALSGLKAALFAGRERTVRRAIDALHVPGSTIVIYGYRGVGKSSLAWQLFELLSGNPRVRARYPNLRVPRKDSVCLWIECMRRHESLEGVLLALMRPSPSGKGHTLRDKLPGLFNKAVEIQIRRAYEFSLAVAKVQSTFDPTEKRDRDQLVASLDEVYRRGLEDPFELFGHMIAMAKRSASSSEVIVFFDEFDRLPNRQGMGDFIKHFGEARSVIIGVADTPTELIGQHPSSERKLLGGDIHVPPLDNDEMKEIYKNASDIVARDARYKPIRFNQDFVNGALQSAGGFPAIAQNLGFQSLYHTDALEVAKRKEMTLGLTELRMAREKMLGSGTEMTDALSQAIGQSRRRAAILDSLSGYPIDGTLQTELRDRLDADQQLGFNENLSELISAKIIEAFNMRVRFSTPVYRLLVLLAKESNTLYPSSGQQPGGDVLF